MRVPRGGGATFGLPVLLTGVLVTAAHGYLNGTFFSRLGLHLTDAWLDDPRFIGGVAIYAAGFGLMLSAANLIPRAIQNHRWYHERFEDYPRSRRVLVPYLF